MTNFESNKEYKSNFTKSNEQKAAEEREKIKKLMEKNNELRKKNEELKKKSDDLLVWKLLE